MAAPTSKPRPSRLNLEDDPKLMGLYRRYIGQNNVNVGSALNHIVAPGRWVNVDSNPDCQAQVCDYVQNLTEHIALNSVDTVYCSHFLEHLRNYGELFEVFDQFWQILKPGGHVLAFVPHGNNFLAWEDPFHSLRFTPQTFSYLCSAMYDTPGNAGYGASQGVPTHPWEYLIQAQIPTPEWMDRSDEELEQASRRYCNVLQEIHCVLRKGGA